jgi:hypothetical protein
LPDLNTDGTIDGTFNPGTGGNGIIQSIVYQPDGKVLIGGSFDNYNGTARNGIARVNADGSLDGSFNPGTGVDNGVVNSIAYQPDGKVLIGGPFTTYDNVSRNRIARVEGVFLTPTISNFPDINKTLYDVSFVLSNPTSNSSGSFSYSSSDLTVATVSGNTVTIVGTGTTTLTATQAASGAYLAGTITATLTVTSVETVTRFGERTLNKQTYPNKNGAIGGQKGVDKTGKEVATKN